MIFGYDKKDAVVVNKPYFQFGVVNLIMFYKAGIGNLNQCIL